MHKQIKNKYAILFKDLRKNINQRKNIKKISFLISINTIYYLWDF